MKHKQKLLTLVVCLVAMLAVAAGCGSQDNEDKPEGQQLAEEKTVINFGTNSNHKDVVEYVKPQLEAKGYTVEVKFFDDPISIDTATQEGSVDINLYQHKPYMENFNQTHNGDLVMVKDLYSSIMGFFSAKYDSLEALPEDAKIAVAQDGSNKDRGLRLMADNGLITLTEQPADGKQYTLVDIAENPKNFEFTEVDLYQLVRSLEDVDAAAINCSYFITAGKDLSQAIAFSKDQERFPVGLVVKAENQDAQWVKDCVELFTTEDARAKMEELFQGSYKLLF